MLNWLMIKLLGTASHRHNVPYARVYNLNINVMVKNPTNRIRLPTCEVE